MLSDIMETVTEQYGRTSLVEMGKIKIGGLGQSRQSRSGGTYRQPVKLDHFEIVSLNRTQSGDLQPDDSLMKQLAEQYGDSDGKLRQIPIRLLSDDIEDSIQSAFCWYGKSTCGARSDGRTVTWFHDQKTYEKLDPPKEEPWSSDMLNMEFAGGTKFKLHSIFSCVIAAKEARWGGVYKFRTTSVISFKQLFASLHHVHQLTGGILMGMPLMLVVRPMQVAPNGQRTTVHVVHVELRGNEMEVIQDQALKQAQYRLAFKEQITKTQEQYRLLLPPPGMETNGEVKDIIDEFVPEANLPAATEHYGILDAE